MGEPDIEKMKADKDVEGLIKALKSEDIEACTEATVALAEIGETAVEPMIQALKDKNKFVRVGVALALGKIGDVRATHPLVLAYTKEKDEYVRKTLIRASAQIHIVDAKGKGWTPSPLRWRCPNCGSVLVSDEFSQGWAGYIGTVTCGVCGEKYPAADVYGGKYGTKPRKS